LYVYLLFVYFYCFAFSDEFCDTRLTLTGVE